MYDKILAKGHELKHPQKAIFFWALDVAEHWDFNQKRGFLSNLSHRIVDRLVFSKWREALGGQVRGIVSGASACPARIMRVFNAAGIRVREGYGLTEAAPALAVNRFDEYGAIAGTVGPLLDGTRVSIVPLPNYSENEGEILSQSPGVMQGYYKNPEKTSETLVLHEGETWLATGDIGKMVKGPDGRAFLQITDPEKGTAQNKRWKVCSASAHRNGSESAFPRRVCHGHRRTAEICVRTHRAL